MVAIFVALMFITFVLADLLVQKLEVRRAGLRASMAADHAVPARTARGLGRLDPWPAVPEGVYLSEGHTWLAPREQGAFRIGANALVGHALGTVSRVIPPKVGKEVWAGGPLFQLERDGRILTVASPATGKVVSVNGHLQDRPELVARAPYAEGWVCALVPTRLSQEHTVLRMGDKAVSWLERELDRFSDFLWSRFPSDLALGVTSLDGGAPASGCLADFDADTWSAFEQEFLRPS